MIDYLVSPTLLSGMGQHLFKYKHMFDKCEFIQLNEIDKIEPNSNVMIYALPIPEWLINIPILKKITKNVICLTVCETETIHPLYAELIDLFDTIAVPSIFCLEVFSKTFPTKKFKIIHAHVPLPKMLLSKENRFGIPPAKYIFYHIGNILDQRKNVPDILRAFQELNLPDCILVMKATCLKDVKGAIPNVYILNGLRPQKIIDHLHTLCDCYVSFSSSEGIGMGAVEAAMCDKPVIIPEFGGATDYIKTPFLIKCDRQAIPRDDFLFQKGMIWGKPRYDQLKQFMLKCYVDNIKTMDHSFTRDVVSKEVVCDQITSFHV
jgi:glycosyltransferase involved in cell wall biosynthesis